MDVSEPATLVDQPTPSADPAATPAAESAAPNSADPAAASGDSAVAAALKRMQTVDLQDGCRPPQTLAQLANPPVACSTVVLMELQGVAQPVSLPLTPEQCLAAGLKLANMPHQPAPPTAAPETAPATAATAATPANAPETTVAADAAAPPTASTTAAAADDAEDLEKVWGGDGQTHESKI